MKGTGGVLFSTPELRIVQIHKTNCDFVVELARLSVQCDSEWNFGEFHFEFENRILTTERTTMGRLSLAWQILTNGSMAERVSTLLAAPLAPAIPAAPAPAPVPPAPKPQRSDALSLLASLQREGRLLDFLKEPIDGYSDAQIGAAVRDIHRECGAVLERQFAIRPVLEKPEGSPVTLSSEPAHRIRLTGKVDSGAASGTLVHNGWMATKCEIPVWSGEKVAISILAQAEVELR